MGTCRCGSAVPAAFSSSSVLADRGDLGPSVDHRRDRVVIDRRLLPGQSLGHGDPFLLGLVRQHRPADRIADRVDAWDVGGKAVIDHDPALAVACDADCVEPQPLGVGSPADRHQRRVGRQGSRARRPRSSTVTPSAEWPMPATLAPSLNSIPWRVSTRCNAVASSRSMFGTIRSSSSTTVTLAPSRCHTEPSSSPI